jgi:two-component system chemotaxis response regulator CheB
LTANRDLLAIGTSAGGFEALRVLAREFPPDLPAAILVVIHLSDEYPSTLDAILSQSGPLPASFAKDGEKLRPGRIYIGPRQQHLLVDGDTLRLGSGPRENHARPAVDPFFRSAALCCGPRVVGVVLTGMLHDGASGLHSLKECGGITVVQDPEDAAFPSMPRSAIDQARPDHVVALAAMPALLDKLVRQPAGEPRPIPDRLRFEVDVAMNGHPTMQDMDRIGRRSTVACPDCHGVMWEIDEGEMTRYRCHVGHAYSAELIDLMIGETFSKALASALRAIEERIAVVKKLEMQARDHGREKVARSWGERLREYEEDADIIRESIRRTDEIAARATQAGK